MAEHYTDDASDVLTELFQISASGISMGLERMVRACELLGHPEKNIRAIQVAGTNGKGSVSGMLDAALRHSGYRVGLFTSPHIHRFTERIRVDGEEISLNELIPLLNRVLALTKREDGVRLTFFEVATLAAFLAFLQARVDVVVLEVGLGGRLDATSVVTPQVGVITSIGLDHTDWLGDTIPQIAREKAGIVKPEMTLCIGKLPVDAKREILRVAMEQNAKVVEVLSPLKMSTILHGETRFFEQPHQLWNAALALEAFGAFVQSDGKDNDNLATFLAAMVDFSVPCRYEWIASQTCHFLLDGAHNMDAMKVLVETLRKEKVDLAHIVFGALKGKPVDEMIALLQTFKKEILIVPAPVARNMDVAAVASKWNLKSMSMTDALKLRPAGKTVLVTGSFFVAADARRLLIQKKAEPPIAL
ncbi:MAG: bifunctional folylpolyglutamate synthase/dihydrofolate synthase [Deltaproteobacteria bacterium]|nr:bifunctional folylpolyglutamate synthase/dihydrofolate synthase [Deltaproteobacteria bacterium]